ncbi:hypothetical protein F4818DRAFT_436376 [Hypoxylon cercidicola]|nr:hypothetical protein F4818DRAFT_436376 [Hypoxylon cercidicola]
MDSRTYSVGELLELRHAQSSGAIKKLKSNHEMVNIIKDQDSMSPIPPPPMKLVNGDFSATDSDEVIFQGKTKPQAQWRYRGRTEAESAKDEPVKAPTGIEAQKSEGFKRFFKAVASPTHVRVTAGGRIVPNTRGSPSPTAKWDKEHSSAGEQEPLGVSKDSKLDPGTHMNGQAPYPLMMPPPSSGHAGVFHHMGLPMPLYPVSPGYAMAYSMQPLSLVHSSGKQDASAQRQKDATEIPKAVKTQDGAGDKKPRPPPINTTNHDQLDQNRPFFYDGNVVYPSPYGPGQPMTLPSPYYHFGVGSISQPSPLGPGYSPAFASPPFTGSGNAGSARRSWQPPMSAPILNMGHHVTSIRPSDVTRRQLDQLRLSLKYFEDQLQYNRHQIDEKGIEDQVRKIRQEIRQFEHKYKQQVSCEAAQLYRPSSSSEMRMQTPPGRSSVRGRRGSPVNGYDRNMMRTPYHSLERRRPTKNRRLKGIGIHYTTGILEPFAPDNPALEALIESAMKRPLETSTSSDTAEMAPQSEEASPGTYGIGESQSYTMRPVDQPDTGRSALMMYDQPMPASFSQSRHSQPYLVGKLPRGMNVYEARPIDYVYERQLTDEEKQARERYWGKVSMPGSGLPKFDGQNFYPPSPVKASVQSSRHPIPTGRPWVDFKMHSGPTDNDPFSSSRTAQSIRPRTGGQKVSKAIPIVDPKDGSKLTTVRKTSQSKDVTDDLCKALKATKISSPAMPSEEPTSEQKSTPSRRAVDRSSNKSSNDLWQTMLKKGSASTAVLPSTVSSTNATGYLPPYQGNAAASLAPSVSNANSSGARNSSQVGDKPMEHDPSQLAAEKVGENCPPSEARSADYDPLKDVQERMIRDAQRRGVIGSDWK